MARFPPAANRLVFAATSLALVLFSMGLLAGPLALRTAAQETKVDPSRIIQYRGSMPLLAREHWGGEVRLKFELYRSPDGGSPLWKETRPVTVRNDGWVNVDLGQVQPLPDEAFTTPFRFLSIWHEAIEFYAWVIPWVDEPTIHARLHELYLGKPVACYYEELSPMNDYAFRLVVEGRPVTQP